MDPSLFPENYHLLNNKLQVEIIEYLNSMDERQLKAYLIAKEHLGSSFNIFKSNGYKEWKTKTD
jgi:predicted house-cleaning noncanonical NTP pyrophosphatase (MazG superfamily)